MLEISKVPAMLRRSLLVVHIYLAAVTGACNWERNQSPVVEIDEQQSFPLPPGFIPMKGLILSDGGIVVGPDAGPLLIISASGGVQELPIVTGRNLLALRHGDCMDCVNVLMSDGEHLEERDAVSGAVVSQWVAAGHEWRSASVVRGRWIVAAFGEVEGTVVYALNPDGGMDQLYTPVPDMAASPGADGTRAAGVLLAPVESLFVISTLLPPHRSVVVNLQGQAVLTFSPPPDGGVPSVRPQGASMVTAATHRWSQAFVQLLADLRGDYRELHIFDENGRLIRTTALVAPWGMIHSDSDRGQLLAVRGTDPIELVVYKWWWLESF